MAKLTEKEESVYKVVLGHCMNGYCSWVSEISDDTGLSMNVVKGVLGSLAKKDLILAESRYVLGERIFNDIFAIVDGDVISFGEPS